MLTLSCLVSCLTCLLLFCHYLCIVASTYPGKKGPKPLRALESVEDEMAPIVRPQKLPLANTVRAWSSGIPLTLYPHLRASLTAVSPPSTPVFMGSTRSYLKAKMQKTKSAGYTAGYSLDVSSLQSLPCRCR